METLPLSILTPVGSLNGDVNQLLMSIAHQTVRPLQCNLLVDSQFPQMDLQRSTIEILRRMKIRLNVMYDNETTSIIQLRRDLIDISYTEWSVFIDSDAILHPDALEKMTDALYNATAKGMEVAFVEGSRIEVGGRQDESNFSVMEKKQVTGSTDSAPVPIPCGDTCLLMFDTDLFKKLPWQVLLDYYDQRGMGGSDFAMTVAALAMGRRSRNNLVGISAPLARCWHTASLYKGYWKNYVAADQLIQTTIGPKLDSMYRSKDASTLIRQIFEK